MAEPKFPKCGGAWVDVRRAETRFVTRTNGVVSRHSFSFGRHYDPANTHHGLLIANNHDFVPVDDGYPDHPHRDLEIVTWVVRGSLVHRDSTGTVGVLRRDHAQRTSAGTGLVHSETNEPWRAGGSRDPGPAEFVQMWVVPDVSGLAPEWEQADLAGALAPGGLVTVASGLARHAGNTALRLHQSQAALHVARFDPPARVVLPDAAFLHLFVVAGSVELEGSGRLSHGDAARVTGGGGQRVRALEPAEILVWEMHASIPVG